MKILVIKPSSFGDIVQANPVVTALKEAYPGCSVSWLVFDTWTELVALFPLVDEKIVWERRGGIPAYLSAIRTVREKKFDLLIDLQGLARTALIDVLSGARTKIGTPGLKEFSWLLVREAYPESRSLNAADRSLETVRFLTGKKSEPVFSVAVSAEDRRRADALLAEHGISFTGPVVSVIPSARGRAKCWPAEHYRELIELILARYPGLKAVVLGGPSDHGIIRHPAAVDLCGKTTMGELAAILKRSRAVVGNDTGPTHLAAALGVPVACIFGGSDIRETAPVPPNAVSISRNLACSPCRGKPVCSDYPCLAGITPGEVFESIRAALAAGGDAL